MNNISFIKDYFSSNIDNIINICELKNTYCLTSITYYINQYLWKIDEYYLKISGKDLTKKYIDFINPLLIIFAMIHKMQKLYSSLYLIKLIVN